jgi:aminoglycoside phosphotransferase (APT) family kinase protein
LEPLLFPVWKSRLLAGLAEPSVAEAVGQRLAHIHAATAGNAAIAKEFANDHIFYPIRLEPYLVFTADRHPALADALRVLATVTAETKRALVHGDVSPKNILVGPNGPVFLDAECAWYGDPAFDLAFCLNHMLLKCLARPATAQGYLACFDALATRYLAGIDWEPRADLEERAARLLPGLFLGRIDGKSPVEYVTDEGDRARVRRVAAALLTRPVARLEGVRAAWAKALAEAWR